MQMTTDQEDQGPSLSTTVAKLVLVWVVLSIVICSMGGGFSHGPKDIPAGMTWTNPDDVDFSTFYVLRDGEHGDGPRIILDLNKHTMLTTTVLLCGVVVFLAYLSLQGFMGRLKNGAGDPLPTSQQFLAGLALAAAVLVVGLFTTARMKHAERLDLDPAADTVSMNGQTLARFQDITTFHAYNTSSRRSYHFHLEMQLRSAPSVALGGSDPAYDVNPLATMLNGYLAEQRNLRQP
ncbi:MAG TPA: hypothetical protein VGM47_02735 [Gammaproteobacteria bacterium]|jgi:hypothetical protein